MKHEFEIHPNLIIVNVPKGIVLSEYLHRLARYPFNHLVINLAQVRNFNLRDLRALNDLAEAVTVDLCAPWDSLRALLERLKVDRSFTVYRGLAEVAPESGASGMKVSLFVFIDAYGWQLFQKHRILAERLQTAAPLETVFGYSSACDPTILTGLQPQEHEHFSFFYYRPEGSELADYRPLRHLPSRLSRSGRVRNVISRMVARRQNYTGYFQLYQVPFQHLGLLDYSEKRDLYHQDGINSGASTIFDRFREQGVSYHCSDWRRSEEENLMALRRDLESGQIRCAYLYLAAMDGILHHHGTKSQLVEEKLAWYDRQLRELLEVAEQSYDSVDLHLFSDHGMTDVTESCDLMARVELLELEFGSDYVAVYDSTMARFWFLNPEAELAIREELEKEERGRWLDDEELEQLGCRFRDQRYGEAFFLLHPGVLLCPSFMGVKPVAGMHGYHPADAHSVALFASTRRYTQPPAPAGRPSRL